MLTRIDLQSNPGMLNRMRIFAGLELNWLGRSIFILTLAIYGTGCATTRPLTRTEVRKIALDKHIDLDAIKYVAIDDDSPNRQILRIPSVEVKFPLSDEDRRIADTLMYKCLDEENCAGLAAPQIGYGKQILFFHVSEEVKNFRDDMYGVVPPTVLFNPRYQSIGIEKRTDWEGCFSVKDTAGEVPRFVGILYTAQDADGKLIKDIAFGFTARLLQHEIGHLNGELWFDLLVEGDRNGPRREMFELRMKELAERRGMAPKAPSK